MKVYVITRGDYSDYRICAVTLDNKKAKILANKCSDNYYKARVEIFDTDAYEKFLTLDNLYSCYCYEESSRIDVEMQRLDLFEENDLKVGELYRHGLATCVFAKNEKEALKIASDKFAKYRAEKMGL